MTVSRSARPLAKALSSRSTAIIGEYPYYRSDPKHWADNLRSLKDLGVQVVSLYVPWRLHETGPEQDSTGFRYDFDGESQPQTDLSGLLHVIGKLGLRALLKPGPYIFAEVRLGGLPDRVVRGQAAAVTDADDRPVTSESLPLPSAYDPWFRQQARDWLTAVRTRILEPYGVPRGPVVGVQLGNEGVYGELELPMSGADFAAPALAARTAYATRAPGSSSVAEVHVGPHAPAQVRAAWSRWSGLGIRERLEEFRTVLGTDLPTTVNLPLPHLSPQGALEAWVCRASAVTPDGTLPGNTSWVGAAALSDDALASLWFGMRALRSDTLEDNWGFTWDGEAWATPQVPVHHALLGLAFGSSTVAVYTACTTHNWPPQIAPDPDGLRAEGKDPACFAPPYCPSAPIDEQGGLHPNAQGLRLLSQFLDRYGDDLARCRAAPSACLVVDPVTLAEDAWPDGTEDSSPPGPATAVVLACTRLMVANGHDIDVVLADGHGLRAELMPSSAGQFRPMLWIVAGGRAMSRAVQEHLAKAATAGGRVVVAGPLPEYDEEAAPCRLLAKAPIVAVPADSWEKVYQVLTEQDADATHRDTGDDVLRLTRSDEENGVRFTFLSNRTDRHVTARGMDQNTEFAVDLTPHGATVLVTRSGHLDGYLATGADSALGPEPLPTPELRVGEELLRRLAHRNEIGLRTDDGWHTVV